MSINLLSDTIDKWREMVRELDARKDHRAAEQARNWLFGAGLALQIMDVEALMEMSKRALEASENGNVRNRNVGADPGDNLGISGVDSQREDLADEGAGR